MKKKEPGADVRAKLRIVRIIENFLLYPTLKEAIFPTNHKFESL